MKLYRVTYMDDNAIATDLWHGSKVAARKEATRLKREGFLVNGVAGVEVPTSKSGLLDFLNATPNTPHPEAVAIGAEPQGVAA